MKGRTERVRGAVRELLAGGGLRRWTTALGRWSELGPFLAYLETLPAQMPTPTELAGIVTLDERALRRRVLSSIGLTPIEAVMTVKFVRAAIQLRESNGTVWELAEREGFASLAAFDHAFRRYVGVSPSASRLVGPWPGDAPQSRPTRTTRPCPECPPRSNF
jgi:transcriptional regulator GlxA family with amidase domain